MRFKTIFAVGVSTAVLSFAAAAYAAEPGVMALSPSEMKWSAQGGFALPGIGARVPVPVAQPDPERGTTVCAHAPGDRHNERRREPAGHQVGEVVGTGRCGTEPRIPRATVANHRVQRIDRPVSHESGQTGHGAPE